LCNSRGGKTRPAILADALSFWVIAYFTIALKHVYGGTWAETPGCGTAILTLYFVIFFVANLLLVFALLALNVAGAGINPAARLFNHA
jgi:hypothetical protein